MEGLSVCVLALAIMVLITAIVLKRVTDDLRKDVDNLYQRVGDLSLTINYHVLEEKRKNAGK